MSKLTRSTQAMILILIGLFMGTSVVAADYIGPNRTYTVQEATSCGYRYTGSGYSSCGANGYLSDPCTCNITCDTCLTGTGNCISIPTGTVNSTCGSGFSEADRWVNYTNRTVNHPPAVASTTWSCPIIGDNGWCQSQFSVQLNGTDPLAGYVITALEGVLDSVPFFADGQTSISFLIGEGSHHLDFWALSSYGDSSTHFIENYYVDTLPPQIGASLYGLPGDNNWFISDTTLVAIYSDPVPGSGLASNSASANTTPIDVSVPVTFQEGIYNLALNVQDTAGLSAQVLYTLLVDTTAPALNADQPPTESDIYMNGSVIFTGTSSDATSGVNRIDVAPDGVNWQPATLNPDGSWILDWDSSVKPDSTYTPLVASTDNAGNRTEISLQPINLDNSAPAMNITGGWYVWDSGHLEVVDYRSGIARIELSVRDTQNRWPAREWDYDTQKLVMDLQWDREFGDGTVAPTGTYEVLLQAWDKLGNGRWIKSHIYIPEAGATAVIPYDGILTAGDVEPTSTPLPTEEISAAAVGGGEPQPTNTPQPTSTMIAVPLSGGADNTVILSNADKSRDSAPANTTPLTDGILWGAAAIAAGAAAALVSQKQLEETRKKEQAKLDAEATERMIQRWSNVVASYGGTYDHEAEVKRIAEKEKFWNDYRIASQQKYLEQLRLEAKTAQEEAAKMKVMAKAAQMEQEEYSEYMRLIASTGGKALTDLSEEQYNSFVTQSPGAAKAAYMYYEQQNMAAEAAQKNASEYSNQVKTFHEGEAESIKSYGDYLAEEQERSKRLAAAALATLNNKMTRDEENTENKNVFVQNANRDQKNPQAEFFWERKPDGVNTDGEKVFILDSDKNDYQEDVYRKLAAGYGESDDMDAYELATSTSNSQVSHPVVTAIDWLSVLISAEQWGEANTDFRKWVYDLFNIPPDFTSNLYYKSLITGVKKDDHTLIKFDNIMIRASYPEQVEKMVIEYNFVDGDGNEELLRRDTLTNVPNFYYIDVLSEPFIALIGHEYESASIAVNMKIYTKGHVGDLSHTIYKNENVNQTEDK